MVGLKLPWYSLSTFISGGNHSGENPITGNPILMKGEVLGVSFKSEFGSQIWFRVGWKFDPVVGDRHFNWA